MFSNKVHAKSIGKSIAALTAVCLCLAGCSDGSTGQNGPAAAKSDEERVFHVASEMDQLVKNAIDEFPEPLPADVQWLDETPANLNQPNTKYEEGMAEGAVTFYWLCAWEKSFLDAFNRGDQAVQDESLVMIEKFQQTPWYKASVEDPEQGWVRDVVTPAKLGDPSGVKREFDFGCSKYSIK